MLVTSCASICDVWPVVESTVVFSTIFSIPAQAMAVCYATASTAIPVVLVPNTVPTSVVVLAINFGEHVVVACRYVGGLGRRACCLLVHLVHLLLVASLLVT